MLNIGRNTDMGKKLQENDIHEGSRFEFPEHREAWIRRQEENLRGERGKPVLNDQEIQLIERTLAESFNTHCKVHLDLFETYEDRQIKGIVTLINRYTREIKLAIAVDDWEWIKLTDIISARL